MSVYHWKICDVKLYLFLLSVYRAVGCNNTEVPYTCKVSVRTEESADRQLLHHGDCVWSLTPHCLFCLHARLYSGSKTTQIPKKTALPYHGGAIYAAKRCERKATESNCNTKWKQHFAGCTIADPDKGQLQQWNSTRPWFYSWRHLSF